MGFEFVFKKDRFIEGYHLEYVKGVEPEGEYGVLEIPSSYRGLPVVGILGIDGSDRMWNYDPNFRTPKKRPHFKHIIFPSTIGYVRTQNMRVQIGSVDKLTLRGWTFRPGWRPEEYVREETGGVIVSTVGQWDIIGRSIVSFIMNVDTVVFEGEEIPPHLFYQDIRSRFAKIKRVVAPNVKIIGEDAFLGNESICEFELPHGLKAIGAYAFLDSGLKNIKIPSTVTYIGPRAFEANQVDRASMRGREWDFEVAPLHTKLDQDIYSKGVTDTASPRARELRPYLSGQPQKPDELWERKNCSAIIAGWLKEEDPDRYVSAWNTTFTKRIEAFFRWNAMVSGANARPKGLWFHINARRPFVIS